MRRIDAALDAAILWAADVMGTRWSALVMFLIPFASVAGALSSHSPVIIVGWLSSNFLQLFFLPVLLRAGNLQAERAEQASKVQADRVEQVVRETHDAVIDELAAIRDMAETMHVHITGQTYKEAS